MAYFRPFKMGQNWEKSLGDLSHERAVWKIEHWGWSVFAAILLAALIGVFGEGPLARARAENTQLAVEYDRFVRYQAPSHFKIHLRNTSPNSMPALSIARDFLERVEVTHISPEPQRVRLTKDALIYIFDVARTNEDTTIAVQFRPSGYGRGRVQLGLIDGQQLEFTQFSYP